MAMKQKHALTVPSNIQYQLKNNGNGLRTSIIDFNNQ